MRTLLHSYTETELFAALGSLTSSVYDDYTDSYETALNGWECLDSVESVESERGEYLLTANAKVVFAYSESESCFVMETSFFSEDEPYIDDYFWNDYDGKETANHYEIMENIHKDILAALCREIEESRCYHADDGESESESCESCEYDDDVILTQLY